jgi:hypothetical protein
VLSGATTRPFGPCKGAWVREATKCNMAAQLGSPPPPHSPTCCSHVLQMAHRIILLAPLCTSRLCIHLHAWTGSSGITYIPNTCSNQLSTHDDAMRQCNTVLSRQTHNLRLTIHSLIIHIFELIYNLMPSKISELIFQNEWTRDKYVMSTLVAKLLQ